MIDLNLQDKYLINSFRNSFYKLASRVIVTLKELSKTLINDVVTGKIKVVA